MLIRREMYNPNRFAVIFRRRKAFDLYVANNFIELGPEVARCEPDGFLLLPHAYYDVAAENGPDVFDMLMNYGDAIGKGNKKNSLPIVEGKN